MNDEPLVGHGVTLVQFLPKGRCDACGAEPSPGYPVAQLRVTKLLAGSIGMPPTQETKRRTLCRVCARDTLGAQIPEPAQRKDRE